MTYDEVRALFFGRLKKDLKVQSLLKKIKDGKADFRDTADYSNLVSSIFGYLMKRNVAGMDDPEETARKLLRDYYDELNTVLGDTQTALNLRNHIGIAPQKADFPEERVKQFAHSLIDPTVDGSVIERRARAGSENIARSLHDDFIEKNAKVRAKAGLKVYIVRETDGNCCKWCSAIAGRYIYGQEPHDVFRRHDNCSCVCYKQDGRQKQDVWSKKMLTEVNTPKESAKPTVLAPEQAKAIQDEKLRNIRVDKSGGSGIIKEKAETAEKDVHSVGKIDIEKFKCITDDITTDEVIITDERIQHINEHHPNNYEMIEPFLSSVLSSPDFILEDTARKNTGILLKQITFNDSKIQLVIRLHTSTDPDGYKNSIISAWTISKTRWNNYLKNKKVLYKSE